MHLILIILAVIIIFGAGYLVGSKNPAAIVVARIRSSAAAETALLRQQLAASEARLRAKL